MLTYELHIWLFLDICKYVCALCDENMNAFSIYIGIWDSNMVIVFCVEFRELSYLTCDFSQVEITVATTLKLASPYIRNNL